MQNPLHLAEEDRAIAFLLRSRHDRGQLESRIDLAIDDAHLAAIQSSGCSYAIMIPSERLAEQCRVGRA